MTLNRFCVVVFLLLLSISSLGWASTILEDASSFNATVSTKRSPQRSSRKLLYQAYYIYFENKCRYSINVLAQAQLPQDEDYGHCNNAETQAGSWCTQGFDTLRPGEASDGWTISGDPTGDGYYWYAEMVEGTYIWEGTEFYETMDGEECDAGTSGCYGFIREDVPCTGCEYTFTFTCDGYTEPATSPTIAYTIPDDGEPYYDDSYYYVPAPAPSCSSYYCCSNSEYNDDLCCDCIYSSTPPPPPPGPPTGLSGSFAPAPPPPPSPPPSSSSLSSSSPSSSSSSSSSSLSTGAIVGIAAGGLAAIATVIGGFFIWRNNRMKEHRDNQNTPKNIINVLIEQPTTDPHTDPSDPQNNQYYTNNNNNSQNNAPLSIPPSTTTIDNNETQEEDKDTDDLDIDIDSDHHDKQQLQQQEEVKTVPQQQQQSSPRAVIAVPSPIPDVSWEVAFKLPHSKDIYVCANTGSSLTPSGNVDAWLEEKLCGGEKWTGWLCYNDQCWEYSTQGTCYKEWDPSDKAGHCKGVLTWNATHVGWLVHSLPHWPCPAEFNLTASEPGPSPGKVYDSQLKLAQNLAFVSSPRFPNGEGEDLLDKIVSQIRNMEAYVYMCVGIDDFPQSKQLLDLKENAKKPKSDTTSSQSDKKREVKSPERVPSDIIGYVESKKTVYTPLLISSTISHIAKSKLYNADIYEVLPTMYKGKWWARTNLNGKILPDGTFDSSEEQTDIIKDMDSLKNLTDLPKDGPAKEKHYICPPNSSSWSQGSEHSKWAVSSSGSYVFVGDNNRIEKQKHRGGGGFLLEHDGLNSALMKWKTDIPPVVAKTTQGRK